MRGSNPCTVVFFVRNPVNAVKKVFIAKNCENSYHLTLKDAFDLHQILKEFTCKILEISGIHVASLRRVT